MAESIRLGRTPWLHPLQRYPHHRWDVHVTRLGSALAVRTRIFCTKAGQVREDLANTRA